MIAGKALGLVGLLGLAGGGLAACGGTGRVVPSAGGPIRVVAAEVQYGDVAAQVGGRYVAVSSVQSNPNTDPHTYEISPGVARSIDSAAVVIQNGLGYDSFMNRIESAASRPGRTVIEVQKLLGLPTGTANPHLWYEPRTMPAVADRLAAVLGRIDPSHAAYFAANAAGFRSSLRPWLAALARLRADHAGAPVASTEPVGDYLLQAAGVADLTPFSFEADVMNGVDPAPQDLQRQTDLRRRHLVRALVYNQQVTDSVTAGYVSQARRAGIPVVGVYEIMPVPGYHYQSWMLAEAQALDRAVTSGVSTEKL